MSQQTTGRRMASKKKGKRGGKKSNNVRKESNRRQSGDADDMHADVDEPATDEPTVPVDTTRNGRSPNCDAAVARYKNDDCGICLETLKNPCLPCKTCKKPLCWECCNELLYKASDVWGRNAFICPYCRSQLPCWVPAEGCPSSINEPRRRKTLWYTLMVLLLAFLMNPWYVGPEGWDMSIPKELQQPNMFYYFVLPLTIYDILYLLDELYGTSKLLGRLYIAFPGFEMVNYFSVGFILFFLAYVSVIDIYNWFTVPGRPRCLSKQYKGYWEQFMNAIGIANR